MCIPGIYSLMGFIPPLKTAIDIKVYWSCVLYCTNVVQNRLVKIQFYTRGYQKQFCIAVLRRKIKFIVFCLQCLASGCGCLRTDN
jgi:hypothetical protein